METNIKKTQYNKKYKIIFYQNNIYLLYVTK